MVTPELLEFIRAEHEAGMSKEELEQLLLAEGGWTKTDVDEAYDSLFPKSAAPTPIIVPAVAPSKLEVVERAPSPTTVASPPSPTLSVSPFISTTVAPVQVLPTPTPSVVTPVAAPAPPSPLPPVFIPPTFHAPEPVTPKEVTTPPVVADTKVLQPVFQSRAGVASSAAQPQPPEQGPILPKEEKPVFAIPAVAKPEVVTPKIEPKPDVLQKEEAKPSALPIALAPGEDFLGIFGTPMQVGAPAPSQPANMTKVFTQPIAQSPAQKKSIGPLSSVLMGKSDVVTAIPSTVEKKPASTPPAMSSPRPTFTAPTPLTAVTAEPASVFKFDFAKMRGANDNPREQIAKANASPSPGGAVFSGENREVKDVGVGSPAPVAFSEGMPAHEKVTLSPRRTMASDLLLRGIAPSRVVPAPIVTKSPPTSPMVAVRPAAQVTSPPAQVNGLASAESDVHRKNNIKRVIGLAIGGLAILTMIGGAVYAFIVFGGPDVRAIAFGAVSQLTSATSFAYKGQGGLDLVLSSDAAGAPRTGQIKFGLDYSGALKNGSGGFGDGDHHVKLSGGLQSGDFAWPTDLESDIRLIGSSLFFHALALPASSNLDPELAKTYWMKVDLSELARELSLSDVVTAQEGYGNFGGQHADTSFSALLARYTPFEAVEKLPDEMIGGISAYHITIKADQEPMLGFASELYRKYIGKELVLTDDKRLRLAQALAKMTGELWIDKETNELIQVSIKGDFDDDMFDVHVKGRVQFVFTLSDYNKPVTVAMPSPILTLEELKVQMELYQKTRDARARDRAHVDRIEGLRLSLAAYKEAKGRYPTALTELYGAGVLATTTVSEAVLKQYMYAPYTGSTPLTKANRCGTSGKVCAYYHIGVNLEDSTDPLLANDDDVTSDIRGTDTAGCGGEKNLSCYDVTPKTDT